MTDDTSKYDGAAGVRFAHAVVDQLGEPAIPPTPANYELWAAYRSGALPDLNLHLKERIAAGESLTPALFDDLFERFFATTTAYAELAHTGESVAHELANALAQLRKGGASAGDFATTLEAAASDMEAAPEPAQIGRLLTSLIGQTREVAARNRVLEAQMESSATQMEKLQRAARQATLEARTDGLTGLANRRQFDRVLSRAIWDGDDEPGVVSLILFDIDHFKRINDVWGHPVGDQVIRYVAKVIKSLAPEQACAARYGGEEFALLLPDLSLTIAETIAGSIRERVSAHTISRKSSGDVIGVITISAGVAVCIRGEDGQSLVRRADGMLYEAKRGGRNRVVSASRDVAAA